MSVEAIAWALKIKAGSPSAKVVLLCLANYADRKGRCWPSQASLAVQTEQSVDTVQRRLAELEDLGILTKVQREGQNGRSGGKYFYLLSIPIDAEDEEIDETTTPQYAAWSNSTTPQLDLNHTAKSSKPHRNCAAQTVILNPSDSEPSIYPSTRAENSKRKAGSPLPENWEPSEKHRALWGDLARKFGFQFLEEDVQFYATEMQDWATANAHAKVTKKSNWDAAFSNWLRRAAPRHRRRPNGQGTSNGNGRPTMAEIARGDFL